jgi:hypothetical protein
MAAFRPKAMVPLRFWEALKALGSSTGARPWDWLIRVFGAGSEGGKRSAKRTPLLELNSTCGSRRFGSLTAGGVSRLKINASGAALQTEVAGTVQEVAIADGIAAIVVTRFNGRSILEQLARVRDLPLERIEALGEALLEFRDANDLEAWLCAEG